MRSEQPSDAILSPTWSPGQTFASLWTYCPQLTTRGPPPCCRCCDPWAASRLEARPLATPGFVQWRQTLANRTLALHLPGGRQLFVTTGGALWTQQRAPAEYTIKEKEERVIFSARTPLISSSEAVENGNVRRTSKRKSRCGKDALAVCLVTLMFRLRHLRVDFLPAVLHTWHTPLTCRCVIMPRPYRVHGGIMRCWPSSVCQSVCLSRAWL